MGRLQKWGSLPTNDILVAEKSKTLLKLGNVFPYHYEFLEINKTRSSENNSKLETEKTSEIMFDLYPNPASKSVTLKTVSKQKINAQVVVMDLTGKSVLTQKITRSEEFIHVHQLQSGMYIVNIFDEDGEILEVKRFVKE